MYGLWWWASPNKAPNSSKKVEEEEGISVVSHVHPKALAHHHLEVEQFYDLFWMMMKPAMRPSGHTFHPSWSWSSLHTEQPHKDSRVKLWVAKLQGNSLFYNISWYEERELLDIWEVEKNPLTIHILGQEDDIQLGEKEGEENYFCILHWPLHCLVPFPSYSNKSVEKHLTFTSYFHINWFSNWSKSSLQSLHCR